MLEKKRGKYKILKILAIIFCGYSSVSTITTYAKLEMKKLIKLILVWEYGEGKIKLLFHKLLELTEFEIYVPAKVLITEVDFPKE